MCLQSKHPTCECLLTGLFYREGLLAPRPTPKLDDHPSSAVRDRLFNLFATTLPIGGHSSIHNLRMCHAVVTGTHWQEVGCGHVDWIGQAQNRDRWHTLVSVVMNLHVPWNAGNFFISCKPVSCSGRTLHHGVSMYVCMYVYMCVMYICMYVCNQNHNQQIRYIMSTVFWNVIPCSPTEYTHFLDEPDAFIFKSEKRNIYYFPVLALNPLCKIYYHSYFSYVRNLI